MCENTVHAAVPRLKLYSTSVEEDRFLEVLDVSIASCSALDRHDHAVDNFGHAICNPMRAKRHDIR